VAYASEEFEALLSVVTHENGSDRKKKCNYYRQWLPTAFKIGTFTGLRLDEVVHLKFKDIFNDDGVWLLKVDNIKVNTLLGLKSDRRKRSVVIAVIDELWEVLTNECNFHKYQGTDRYILSPELGRKTVHSIVSKGFTHYKRVAKINGKKSFKELRTTFATKLIAKYGEKYTSFVTDHTGKDVVDKHYTDKKVKAKTMKDFSVFGNSTSV
jgi:integrase